MAYHCLFEKCQNLIVDLEKTNNKLVISNNLIDILINHENFRNNKPYYVISMFGKSRVGKSTYLNIICSYLTGKNCSSFEISNDMFQCTKGVNVNVLTGVDNNIFLLDFRGTDNGNSAEDLFLSMFAYLVSDIVVINESKMLYNSTLKTNLEPVIMFASKFASLDNSNKYLFFRIIDSNLLDNNDNNYKSIDSVVSNILDHSIDDQFKQTKLAIKKLYNPSNIYGIATLCETSERKSLSNSDYLEIINKNDNYFAISINRLIKTIESIKKDNCNIKTFVDNLIKITNNINKEHDLKTIDKSIFDNYTNYFEKEILKWFNIPEISKIINYIRLPLYYKSENVLSNINLKSIYLSNVKKENIYRDLLDKFDKEFEKITDCIKLHHRNTILELYKIIQYDYKEIYNSGIEIMNKIIYSKLPTIMKIIKDRYNNDVDFYNFDAEIKQKMREIYITIQDLKHDNNEMFDNLYCPNAVNHIYESINIFYNTISHELTNKLNYEYQHQFKNYDNFIINNKNEINEILNDIYSKSKISITETFENNEYYKKATDILYNMIIGKAVSIKRCKIDKIIFKNIYDKIEYQFTETNNESCYNKYAKTYFDKEIIPKIKTLYDKYSKDKLVLIKHFLQNNKINNDLKEKIIKANNNRYVFIESNCIEHNNYCESHELCNFIKINNTMILISDDLKITNKYFSKFICKLLKNNTNKIINYTFSHNELDFFIIKKIYNEMSKYNLDDKEYKLFSY